LELWKKDKQDGMALLGLDEKKMPSKVKMVDF